MQTTRYQQADEAIRRLNEMGTTKNYATVSITLEPTNPKHLRILKLIENMQTDYGEHIYAYITYMDKAVNHKHIYVLYVGQDTDNWEHEFINDNGVFRHEVLDIVVHKPELSKYTAIKCVCENGELKIIG